MQQVYSNSFLNISALASRGSDESLFVDRAASALQEPRLQAAFRFDDIDPRLQEYRVIDHNFWKEEVHNAPLNRRGWVLQERLLCPRVLHFGRQQLLWECCELDAAEKYPNGLPEVILDNNSFARFKDLNAQSYCERMLYY